MVIGVLDLQGAVSEHVAHLTDCGVDTKLINERQDLTGIDGLVIPGGESTTMRKLLVREDMLTPLRLQIAAGLPVFGTCAGLVLLAQSDALAGMNATVERNGFGRQRDSFETALTVTDWQQPFHGVFIRAPFLKQVQAPAKAIVTLPDGRIVAARQKHVLVTAFHPELTTDLRFHQLFIDDFVQPTLK